MIPTNVRENLRCIQTALCASEGYVEILDDDYGVLFQFRFVPCCIPLKVIVWLNPVSEGVFIRIHFPEVAPVADHGAVCTELNEINHSLPIGVFTANSSTGEVRFKSAVYIGDSIITVELLSRFLGSAGEMVRSNYQAVLKALTGRKHVH